MEVEKDYASKGVAGAGLGLGIAGTALGLLNGGLGWGLGGNAAAATAGAAGLAALADKDARIAKLEAERYADNKVLELYKYQTANDEKLMNELCLNRQRLAVAEAQIAQMSAVIHQLTVVRIPNSMLCPGVPAVEVIHPTTTASTTPTA